MKISSIIDIVDGELLNSPSISFIYEIKTNVNKVKEGDLFIAKNQGDINLAIQKNTFALLVDKDYPISDKEIAWIKVENIELAIIKLIRYKLSISNLEAYYCDKASYDLLKIFAGNSPKNIVIIPNNLNDFLKILDDIVENTILIYHNKELLDMFYPQNKNFNTIKEYKIDNLIEHSLFETSFSYKNHFFAKLKIPSIYIPQFITVYNFLEYPLDTNKLKTFYNLKPLFLDKTLNLVEFGKSDRFLLCQQDNTLIKEEINFVNKKYKYAKTVYISSKKIDFLEENQIILKDINDLKSILKKISFNAVYLIGFKYKDIFESLNIKEEQNLLF